MAHLTDEKARAFEMHGVTFTSFAAGATGARTLAAWRADFAPDTPGQAHTMAKEEVLYVLSGVLDIEIDDERFTAEAGDCAIVPAGAVLRVTNSTPEPAGAWVTSLIGMTASMQAGGDRIAPPWAQ
ncbi:cupin domain-containing protein [Rhodococcus sp. D2-41]|uniref:Cupin domain-containing protein n=1 Tax=Speluncibacter jeojiensis TaxID=2710754 RepID=A0A9X4M1J5_9ACTN|nr:cupin domain-containing protein [Rhodococcus sp. D2-41]MDG3008980.1 cupin domain-containing protein [Rhodococcus sp. D2-41]MDG3015491.1 cupin domain-containing protein [Corynebacteriales bacterium D3-21]